jgi:hypothetical protein
MEKIIEKIFDLKKIPTKLFVLLTIISGGLLFIPKSLLENLHLNEFENDYGKYFGIIFLISAGIVLLNFSIWLVKTILGHFVKKKYKKFAIKNLKELDPHEKAVIREFFINHKNSLEMPLDNAVVKGLINKRIVIRISTMGQANLFAGMLFPMKLNDNIKDKITEEILGLPKTENEDEIRNFVNENRPKWAKEIDRMNRLF